MDDHLGQTVFENGLERIASNWPFITRSYTFGSSGRIDRWQLCSQLFPHVASLSVVFQELENAGKKPAASMALAELLCEAAE